MSARWSRTHSSAKILSMKRSARVSFVSQCTTSQSECAVTGSIFGGAFISCSRAVTSIDGTGYIVSPLDGVNGVRGNLLARAGCRWVAACPARERRLYLRACCIIKDDAYGNGHRPPTSVVVFDALFRSTKIVRFDHHRHRQPNVSALALNMNDGDPGMTRTCDLRFRKPSLYPAELRDRINEINGLRQLPTLLRHAFGT